MFTDFRMLSKAKRTMQMANSMELGVEATQLKEGIIMSKAEEMECEEMSTKLMENKTKFMEMLMEFLESKIMFKEI